MTKKDMLPPPVMDGEYSLESVIRYRRTVRDFNDEPLSIEEISQLLWAAQGKSNPRGYRTAPSAGALFPIELYVVSDVGLSHYDPEDHSLTLIHEGDLRARLCKAALSQKMIFKAPVTFVFAVVYKRVEVKYGPARTPRYVHLEVGHAAQNLLLQAVSLDLGATAIGAFEDERVRSLLGIPKDHEPIYLIPVGRPK